MDRNPENPLFDPSKYLDLPEDGPDLMTSGELRQFLQQRLDEVQRYRQSFPEVTEEESSFPEIPDEKPFFLETSAREITVIGESSGSNQPPTVEIPGDVLFDPMKPKLDDLLEEERVSETPKKSSPIKKSSKFGISDLKSYSRGLILAGKKSLLGKSKKDEISTVGTSENRMGAETDVQSKRDGKRVLGNTVFEMSAAATSESGEGSEIVQESKRAGKRIVRFLEKTEKDDSTFLMRVQPARILKDSVAALSDSKFNPSKLGWIEARKWGFEITVNWIDKNAGNVFGLLSLRADGLREFQCPRRLKSMVSLHAMKAVLNGVSNGDDDIVTVFHVYQSGVLSFEFKTPGTVAAPGTTLTLYVDLLADVPVYKKFPNVSYVFGEIVASKDLLMIIEHVKNQPVENRPDLVSVTYGTNVKIKADKFNVKAAAKSVLAWIVWPYWESLEKAAGVTDRCRICLVTDPENSIMLRFDMAWLGNLVYLVNADHFFDSQLPYEGDFSSLH